jgi:hypothetical protein
VVARGSPCQPPDIVGAPHGDGAKCPLVKPLGGNAAVVALSPTRDWFSLHVLFAEVVAAGPFCDPVPDSRLSMGAVIAVAAGIALIRYHANMIAG